MSKIPPRYFLVLCIILFIPLFFFVKTDSVINGALLSVGLGVIFFYLIGKKVKDYFDPMYLFSIYYIFVYVAAFVTYLSGLNDNVFISATYFYYDIEFVYTLSLVICIVCYLSVLAGYTVFVKKGLPGKPSNIVFVNSRQFLFLAFFVFCLGLSNFIYNVYYLYGGDIVSLYKNISIRSYDYAGAVTTVGYNFLYAGAYMIYIRHMQTTKLIFFTYAIVLLSVLVFVSSGRITNSVFYISSFLMIYYYNRGLTDQNKKFFFIGIFMAVGALIFYALRYLSSIIYNDMQVSSDGKVTTFLFDFFKMDNLSFFIIEKGNMPNFAMLMKVVDSWGQDVGYMFGSTFLYPLYGFMSSDFFGLIPMPAVTAKEVWFANILGGNLPVTGMGEMVLNFSIVGAPVGMFLLGAMVAFLRNIYIIKRSNIYLIFYSSFCFFFLLYPKGEFNNFNLFWMAFPSFVFMFLYLYLKFFLLRIE